MRRRRVLVVDDEPDVRDLLRTLLERASYDVCEAEDGLEGLRAVYRLHPDLVLLDVEMPGVDGLTALERIRELTDVPVLIVSGHRSEGEKVEGLEAGADGYVTKPFGRQELLARVAALLRRRGPAEGPPGSYADRRLTIDFAAKSVRVDGESVRLTPLEFRLLVAFVENRNQVLSHEQLLEHAWLDPAGVSPAEVKLYVGYLRGKLGWDAGGPIETVRGVGYRYTARS